MPARSATGTNRSFRHSQRAVGFRLRASNENLLGNKFCHETAERKTQWVPLDKSEGGVKDKNILSVFLAPLALPERLRTKTLEISR
ncbi:MAG: hypothetical protein WAM78_16755 [Candidatus Sulfotelmatobacter sp.]